MKTIVCFVLCMILISTVQAEARFTQTEVQRLKEAKELLMDTETRSLDEIAKDLEKTGLPQEHLEVYVAIALTFRDIINNYGEYDTQARARLLDKIRLNMAYFQFGGQDIERPEESELNKLIRRKLKQYVPKAIWDNSELFHSLNDT